MKHFINKNSWLCRAQNIGLSNGVITIIIVLSLISTISEIIGVGLFLPIFQFINLDGDLDALTADSAVWRNIIDVFIYINFEPTLLTILLISFSFFLGRQLFFYIRLKYVVVHIIKF